MDGALCPAFRRVLDRGETKLRGPAGGSRGNELECRKHGRNREASTAVQYRLRA